MNYSLASSGLFDSSKINDHQVQKNLAATAAIVDKSFVNQSISDWWNGVFSIHTQSIGFKDFCAGEDFYLSKGISGGTCAGVLVGEDLILTAAHCISRDSCKEKKIIFGIDPQNLSTHHEKSQLFSCIHIEYRKHEKNMDIALVRLDRKAEGIGPVNLNLNQKIGVEDFLYTIGTPFGLPRMYSNGHLTESKSSYSPFDDNTNIPAYPGNSGGPVFNASTGLLEGIMVGGGTPLIYRPEFKSESVPCLKWEMYNGNPDFWSGSVTTQTRQTGEAVYKSTMVPVSRFDDQLLRFLN